MAEGPLHLSFFSLFFTQTKKALVFFCLSSLTGLTLPGFEDTTPIFSFLTLKGQCNQLKSYTADSASKERNHTRHHLMKEPQGVQTWVRRLHLQILRESILRKWCCGVFQTLQYFIHLSKSLVEENKWKKRKEARFGELRNEQVGDKHLMLFH